MSQYVTLDDMVIVLPVCSLSKWTVTTTGGCISVGRFVRVSVWSACILHREHSVMWEVTGRAYLITWLHTGPIGSLQDVRVVKKTNKKKNGETMCIPS